MHMRRRHFGRELGTALAVLAIYLLTVLTPLHQARASQLEFSALGYAALDEGWVLCGAQLPGGDAGKQIISKCPVSGVGKSSLVLPVSADPRPIAHIALAASTTAPPRAIAPPAVLDPAAPPRAPPIAS